jgi:hypothetical protein
VKHCSSPLSHFPIFALSPTDQSKVGGDLDQSFSFIFSHSEGSAMGRLITSLLLLASVEVESVYNFGTRVDGALFHFEFPREECVSGTFSDSGRSLFGNLNRNMDTTSCNNGLGVALENYYRTGSAQVKSDYNATDFIDAMNGLSNYTLEIWKRSADNQDNDRAANAVSLPIVTIGADNDDTQNTCGTNSLHTTYNLQSFETELVTDGGVRAVFVSVSLCVLYH